MLRRAVLTECARCGFEECACLGGFERKELDRHYNHLKEVCERQGIQTASASITDMIERLERQMLMLKGDVLRLSIRARDPSGRWG